MNANIKIITAKIDIKQSSQILQMLYKNTHTHNINKYEYLYDICTSMYIYVIEIAFIIGLYFDMGTTGTQTSLN